MRSEPAYNALSTTSGHAATTSFTLGIEEEFQVVDPETRELRSHIQEMFAEGEKRLKDEIKREMHESVDRGRHADLPRHRARRGARSRGCAARSSRLDARERPAHRRRGHASHLALGERRRSPDATRYDQIVYDLQMVARANLIFGLHVHVGGRRPRDAHPDHERGALLPAAHLRAVGELAVLVRPATPAGRATARKVFERFPRTGIPDYFRACERVRRVRADCW